MHAALLQLPLAHAGHWLESIAFALPPLVLIGAVVAAAVIARRQEAARGGSPVQTFDQDGPHERN